ncbi:transposase [Clostridium botulinum C]|uniref:Transposase n=2 Tax=Clostridium botulinum TaxID=1491 RepID=A0A9Q4XVD7_CLOBO|nr:hypothetical protein [Clostridium botulinum]YP_398438.1 transposase [Clostridium phage c-st]YP_398451.1 transposase [Clostridium phage c-st]YP_398601.1 transposase [Clostridium phage c-st]MCD3200327.1 transposase [Clostridium botulinum C]MCD3207559.1 transposase [Clostridium botulinum C]MCD3226293.1 transposase [Clostridium botulinum C]MCD3247996.1 transposase [Clostridium botulinum C]MCD3255295.1 transposase [Clostridium botulinum C]
MAKSKTSSYILTLKLKTEKYQEDILNKRLEISRNIYNSCLGEILKRYKHTRELKDYRKEYKNIIKMSKDKERSKKFNELNKKYDLTEYSLHTYVKPIQKHFKDNVDSFTAQKIATRVFNSFQKLMFHQAKRVYFKRYGELNSVEGKSNKTGIRFQDNSLIWNGLKIPVIIKTNDIYVQMSLENRVKYCRIIRRIVKGKIKFYVQLILEGIPPMKINKTTGEIKNKIGKGNVGIDIGTRTIAVSSENDVKLLELAPEIDNIENQKRILNRKLDRQRRANNPNKYNEDGTINRNNKDKWIKSNRYIKTQNKLKEIQRKQAEIRKQSHYRLINRLLLLGNRFLVETMNYKGLQARVKETTINEKTGRFNKKKRFGKSLANKAPSMFLTMLDNKLKWNNTQLFKIDTKKCKASQYNHFTNEYCKKELKDRWNEDIQIQRDMYSAFLIMNVVGKTLDKIDRDLCIETYDNFRRLHDKEIERLKELKKNGYKLISSMGI